MYVLGSSPPKNSQPGYRDEQKAERQGRDWMEFRSNNCVAIHLRDLKKAEKFYGSVMGFKLLSKSKDQLEYDTGHFLLYINRGKKIQPPIPSFSVANAVDAKNHLKKNGCKMVDD